MEWALCLFPVLCLEHEIYPILFQLSGVERYAVHFLEATQTFANEELEIDAVRSFAQKISSGGHYVPAIFG